MLEPCQDPCLTAPDILTPNILHLKEAKPMPFN